MKGQHQCDTCDIENVLQRPLMPSSMSTLGVTDQLANHEKHLSELRVQIEDHLQSPPPKSSKARHFSIFIFKTCAWTFLLVLHTVPRQ